MTVEKEIAARLERIFSIKKVTFDRPGESREQECIFVDVVKSDIRIRDAREIAKIEGTIHVFGESSKMPVGYFAKKIDSAESEDTRGFFFGSEESVETFRNIVERKFGFTFLFDSQYDPAIGKITSLNTSYAES